MRGETSKSFDMFLMFRDMGKKRNLRILAEKLGLSYDTFRGKARKWSWTKRARAWDDRADSLANDAFEKKIIEMSERHAKLAEDYIDALFAPIREFKKRVAAAPFAEMSAGQIYQLSLQAARVFPQLLDSERKSRGLATEISQQDVTSNGETVKVILPDIPKQK